jgi:lysophospholipase L1-like esterase
MIMTAKRLVPGILLIIFFNFAQAQIRVACIGDSITEGAGIESGKKYPDQLQKLLGSGYSVKNFGVSGRTLLKKGDFPYWNEKAYKDALVWDPQVVIIKLGTNDSKPQNWKYSAEFESDYRELLQSFKSLAAKPVIYLCTPLPVFKDRWGIRENVVRDEVTPLVKKIAAAEGLKVIDLYTAMGGEGALLPDGVHPDAGGATVMAHEVYQVVR